METSKAGRRFAKVLKILINDPRYEKYKVTRKCWCILCRKEYEKDMTIWTKEVIEQLKERGEW